jgi:hypothetical protein
MPTPTEILEKMESVSARIEAVAKDLDSGADQFAEVDPYRLAVLLGRQPEEFESCTKYGYRVSLDDYGDPIHYHLASLEGNVSKERFQEITTRSKAFEAGKVETDAELTPSERKNIEDSLSEEKLDDGGGWIVASETIESATGIELEFQAEIGDGGECFGCYGPYQIRDGQGPDLEEVVEGESW